MLDLDFDPDSSRAELAPARALLTPTWVAALALLVANDHWLKGSGLVPGALTGKLSDFAGMIVAPVLLASLLRVRSRRALALCHVAVAAVFAGIQLSPAFASQWSALMGLVGHPWAITCDPTDLIALPFLLVSWTLLVPEMDRGKPALVPIQRTAVATSSVFGLWSMVATSEDSGIDPDGEWYFDVYGHVYVNNANDFEISLHIRPLRDDLDVDCNEVSLDPGRLLTQDAFGDAEHWELPGRTNVAIEFGANFNCGAAMIAGEGIPPVIVFASRTAYAPQWFSGQTFADGELGAAGMAVEFGDAGGEWVGGEMIRFTPKTAAPELPQECEATDAESRLDWPTSVPSRDVELLELSEGVDGCFELLVQQLDSVAGEITSFGAPFPFYLCAPAATVPLTAGERLHFAQSYGAGNVRELSVTLLDYETLDTAVSDSGVPLRTIRYTRGSNDLDSLSLELSHSVSGVPAFGCPWMVEDGCATVERPTDLAVGGVGFLEPGVAMELDSEDGGAAIAQTVVLSWARERAVVDGQCAPGAQQLRYDLDYAIIEEPAL